MKASMRSAITRIFILFLLVCAGSFAWESSRNSEMQPATGQVIGTVYKGYRISYELQEQRYQFETRFGIVDLISGLRSLRQGDPIPLLVDPAQRHAELINTLNGRHGVTLSFVALLCLFIVGVLLSILRRRGNKLF